MLTMFAVPASAEAQTLNGTNITWELTKNNTVLPNGDTGMTLIIDGTGDMPDFKNGYGSPWLSYSSNITTIEIGANVTKIGKYAFISCQSVSDVTASAVTPPTLGGSILSLNENMKIHVPAAMEAIFGKAK